MSQLLLRNQIDIDKAKKLTQDAQIDFELAKLFVARKIYDVQEVELFFSDDINNLEDANLLKDMELAVKRINFAIDNDEKIVIYGDYDCDGIGGISILYLALLEMGAKNVNYFVPLRHSDGYGLSIDALDKIITDFQPNLIITVDCGVTSTKEVLYLKSLGIDIVVTDHHEVSEILPECIVINPIISPNCKTPLCGAGVAFKLVTALRGIAFAYKYLDICAISTVADIVPLLHDNRLIVKHGLKLINSSRCRVGIKFMLRKIGHKEENLVNSYDLAFKVVPRLNASGRLSTARKSIELFTEKDEYSLTLIVEELETENKKRQALCIDTFEEAKQLLKNYNFANNRIIILCNPIWDVGVIGIAASKLCEEFNRPTILLVESDGILKGSCRSITGINIFELLQKETQLLLKFGGHTMAAGLSLQKSNLDLLIHNLNENIKNLYQDNIFEDIIKYDLELSIADANISFAKSITQMEPFGMGNQKPVFMDFLSKLQFMRISHHPHFKCKIPRGIELLAFNCEQDYKFLNNTSTKFLTYSISLEYFQNRERVKGYIKNIVYKEYNITATACLQSYIKLMCHKTNKTSITSASYNYNEFFGHMVICFSVEKYKELCQGYPTYQHNVGNIRGINPYNTVLLAPELNNDFRYFSTIELKEQPPIMYKTFLESQTFVLDNNCSDEPNFNDLIPPININIIRQTYVALRDYQASMHFISIEKLYKDMVDNSYGFSELTFVYSYCILKEMNLIDVSSEGILIINKTKVDIQSSLIYNWLLGRSAI